MISENDIFLKAGLPDEIHSHILLVAVGKILHRQNNDSLEQNDSKTKS